MLNFNEVISATRWQSTGAYGTCYEIIHEPVMWNSDGDPIKWGYTTADTCAWDTFDEAVAHCDAQEDAEVYAHKVMAAGAKSMDIDGKVVDIHDANTMWVYCPTNECAEMFIQLNELWVDAYQLSHTIDGYLGFGPRVFEYDAHRDAYKVLDTPWLALINLK